jgi:hypothetical protein
MWSVMVFDGIPQRTPSLLVTMDWWRGVEIAHHQLLRSGQTFSNRGSPIHIQLRSRPRGGSGTGGPSGGMEDGGFVSYVTETHADSRIREQGLVLYYD